MRKHVSDTVACAADGATPACIQVACDAPLAIALLIPLPLLLVLMIALLLALVLVPR